MSTQDTAVHLNSGHFNQVFLRWKKLLQLLCSREGDCTSADFTKDPLINYYDSASCICLFFLTEAEKAAQKAEEEKAKALVPVKAGKGRDLPPIKVPRSKQEPISNGSSDLNSPTNSSDRDDSSDNANQSDSDNSGDKVDSSDVSDHKHSSDLANHEDCKSHADNDNHSNSGDHKHMNGSAFEKAEFHNKMNKLEERHTISTVQTVQIPGGSEVRTVQTVELRKITTNGTQQATFKNHNHEE